MIIYKSMTGKKTYKIMEGLFFSQGVGAGTIIYLSILKA